MSSFRMFEFPEDRPLHREPLSWPPPVGLEFLDRQGDKWEDGDRLLALSFLTAGLSPPVIYEKGTTTPAAVTGGSEVIGWYWDITPGPVDPNAHTHVRVYLFGGGHRMDVAGYVGSVDTEQAAGSVKVPEAVSMTGVDLSGGPIPTIALQNHFAFAKFFVLWKTGDVDAGTTQPYVVTAQKRVDCVVLAFYELQDAERANIQDKIERNRDLIPEPGCWPGPVPDTIANPTIATAGELRRVQKEYASTAEYLGAVADLLDEAGEASTQDRSSSE